MQVPEDAADPEEYTTKRTAKWVGNPLKLSEPVLPPPDDQAIINGRA